MVLPQRRFQTVLAVLLLLLHTGLCARQEIKGSMYSSSMCQNPGQRKKVQWLSVNKSAIITGKSDSDPRPQCKIIFGLASHGSNARLKIKFDFIYFHNCDIKLQINQSTSSDFDNSHLNKEMFLSGCYSKNPGTLYALPKHYILLSLSMNGEIEQAYNFRLNISVAENLPSTGPALHAVIIPTFVCLVLVVSAAVLFLKYVIRMSYHWHEERREQAMTRAINLYNSNEPIEEEPEMVFIQPGGSGSSGSHSGSGSGGGQRGARPKQRGMEIAFVHSDGRIERFRPLEAKRGGAETPDNDAAQAPNAGGVSSFTHRPKPQKSRLATNVSDRPQESERGPFKIPAMDISAVNPIRHTTSNNEPPNVEDYPETASLGGVDLPPTYEEALHMPLPKSGEKEAPIEVTTQSGDTNSRRTEVTDSRSLDYVNYDLDSRMISSSRIQGDGATARPPRDPEHQPREAVEDLEELGPDSANYMNFGGRLELLSQDSGEGDDVSGENASASHDPLLP